MGNEDAGESVEKSHYIRLDVFFAPKVMPVVFIGGATWRATTPLVSLPVQL